MWAEACKPQRRMNYAGTFLDSYVEVGVCMAEWTAEECTVKSSYAYKPGLFSFLELGLMFRKWNFLNSSFLCWKTISSLDLHNVKWPEVLKLPYLLLLLENWIQICNSNNLFTYKLAQFAVPCRAWWLPDLTVASSQNGFQFCSQHVC